MFGLADQTASRCSLGRWHRCATCLAPGAPPSLSCTYGKGWRRRRSPGRYLLSLVGTLYCALGARRRLPTVLFAVVQIIALLFYLAAYFPGGTYPRKAALLDQNADRGRRHHAAVRRLDLSSWRVEPAADLDRDTAWTRIPCYLQADPGARVLSVLLAAT